MVGWQRNCIQSLTRHFGKARLVEATSTPPHGALFITCLNTRERNLLADSSSNVPSPNTLNPPPPSLKQVQYVLTQDPNKIDLVGNLVRGMRVQDVLSQLAVTDKQAAKAC